jgi:hypothetical protein
MEGSFRAILSLTKQYSLFVYIIDLIMKKNFQLTPQCNSVSREDSLNPSISKLLSPGCNLNSLLQKAHPLWRLVRLKIYLGLS